MAAATAAAAARAAERIYLGEAVLRRMEAECECLRAAAATDSPHSPQAAAFFPGGCLNWEKNKKRRERERSNSSGEREDAAPYPVLGELPPLQTRAYN